MKKVIYATLIVAIPVLTMLSCTKKEVKPDADAVVTSQSQLIELSEAYQANIIPMKDVPKWLKVIGADIEGFRLGGSAGAVTGGGIGALDGDAQNGALWGLTIGGVLGGAASSIKEGGEGTAPPPNTVPGSSLPANIANPQDDIGRLHYDYLHAYVISQGNSNVQSSYPFLVSQLSVEMNMTSTELSNYYSLQQCQSDVNSSVGLQNSQEYMINQAYTNGEISLAVKNQLVPYAQAFDASNPQNGNDLNNFVNFSMSAEGVVVNTSSLGAVDRAYVLGYMATARYGMQYWYQYK